MAYKRDSLYYNAPGETQYRSTLTFQSAIILLALTAVLGGLLPAYADQAAPTPLTHLFCTRTVNGQLLLRIRLTGTKGQTVDANFILDTGVNKCSITNVMADRLGLKSKAGVGDDGRPLVFNGTVAQLVRVPLLELGGVPCGPVPCVILDAKALSAATGQAVDGILGNNFLLALPALINLQSNEVAFFEPGPVTADKLRSVGMADATSIPLDDLDNNGTYACMTRIENGGKSLQKDLMLDTGSAATMINGSDAHKLGLSTQGKPASEVVILTGPAKVYQGMITAITLGGGAGAFQAPMPLGSVTTRDVMVAYPKGDLPDFLPAHLGRDVLGHFLLLMDFAEKKMFIKPLLVPSVSVGGR